MDNANIDRIFFGDGYRLAGEYLHEGISTASMKQAIGMLYDSVDGLLHSFLQRSQREDKPAHCIQGCHWCCYQPVYAVTHELLYLQDYIHHQLPAARQKRFREAAGLKAAITLEQPLKELKRVRESCPFLEDSSCSVYPVRPMACRLYLSFSESSCRNDYEDPGNSAHIPQLFQFPLRAGRMLNEGFVAYLKEIGLHLTELPLEQGYSAAATLNQDLDSWISSRQQDI
jgi:Fe-S-cluster containining protein